jgi:hypothetical protein
MPAAIIALTEVCLKTLKIFPMVKNWELKIATIKEKIMRNVNVGYLLVRLINFLKYTLIFNIKG